MSATPTTTMIPIRRRPVVALILAAASLRAAGPAQPFVPVAQNTGVTITVDAAQNVHPIDPRIYGVAFADPSKFADLGVTINRWGGNATSRHNWLINTTNRAKDYYFENIPDNVSVEDVPGQAADDFIAPTLIAGADAIMTIPMMGMLPKLPRPTFAPDTIPCGYSVLKYGPQDQTDVYRPDCGNGKVGGQRLFGNNPGDTSVTYDSSFQAQWIQHMVDTHKTVLHPNGVRYYALDNEPSLWSFDHWDVHPDGATMDEVWNKMADYGAVIKATDPAALTTGVEEWGWDGYFYSGLDLESYPSHPDRDAHGGVVYAEYLLQQARDYEQTNGTRIVDFFTLHFYPQGDISGHHEFSNDTDVTTQVLRNRSTRALWDKNYVDQSYIGGTGLDEGKVRLIPRLRQWANNDYPGTKIGITEYNWGAENHINGATAQADILGIFGREGLDLGVRWTAPPTGSAVYKSIQMYRNYDGAHNKFGDMSVAATNSTAPASDDLATFAAIRTSDSSLTVMIVAKALGTNYDATVNLANFNASGTAELWQLAGSPAAITPPASVTVVGSSLSLTVPAQSVTLLVIPGQYQVAPSGLAATWNPADSRVVIQWNGAAASYEVFRKAAGGSFASLGATSTCNPDPTTFCDSSAMPSSAYLYEVRAIGAGIKSGFSNIDVATTFDFTDNPPVSIKAVHITELQAAVNAVRNLVTGLGAQAFQPVTVGTPVAAEHIRELRRGVNQARAWLGLAPTTYTDPAIASSSPIKSQHILDLRSAVQ